MGVLWLVFGALWALLAAIASFRWMPRDGHIDLARKYWDVVAQPAAEMPAHMLGIALAVMGVMAVAGAHRDTPGAAGAVLTAVAVVLLGRILLVSAGEAARIDATLRDGLGANFLDDVPAQRRAAATAPVRFSEWRAPLARNLSGIETVADVPYGPHGERNRLDVLRPAGPVVPGRPVLLHMHGGGYAWGRKNLSALPLLHRMARAGWVVVTINYRLVPAARWPAPLVDAKLAVAWIREHIAAHGGNPGFIAATGGSAGGNLSLLLATTAGQAAYQPRFEQADTRIQAAVPVYAGLEDYDFSRTDDLLVQHTRENVMPPAQRDDIAAMGATLPVRNLSADAPPVLIVTGTLDALAIVEGARGYAQRLRAVSRQPVLLAEVQGAFHGFDDVGSLRTHAVARGVHQFLEHVHARWRAVEGTAAW